MGKLKKARKIKENPIFHLYFLEKYDIIQEKQLTLKHETDGVPKVKYDKAVDELEKLLMKRKERDNKQLLKAFSESEKTLAGVIEFLQGNKSSED